MISCEPPVSYLLATKQYIGKTIHTCDCVSLIFDLLSLSLFRQCRELQNDDKNGTKGLDESRVRILFELRAFEHHSTITVFKSHTKRQQMLHH